MRLHSLEVEHFRAIRSAALVFGRGLNVVHGPNDLGKSTLTDAIRAALLVAPASAEARAFATWGAAAGQRPKVVLTFECQGAIWRVEKVFGVGTKAKAYLEKSTDGGTRYHTHAEGRDVEGRIRELLSWGLPAPGGRGPSQRAETYLTTALLGKQGGVSAIFGASLKNDLDETGRALVTQALDALGQDPVVTRLLERLKARTKEVYSTGGRHRWSADSPLVRARQDLGKREERLRELEESARQGKEIEEQTRHLLKTRETALEARERAVCELSTLREYAALADRRQQFDFVCAGYLREFERVTDALSVLEVARRDCHSAQAALTVAAEEQARAAEAASLADTAVQMARDRLARAQSAHESSQALASSARDLRVSGLRMQIEKAATRKKVAQDAVAAGTELGILRSQLISARAALDEAQRELIRASAEVDLSSALEELHQARVLTDALDSAALEHDSQLARERAGAAVLAQADTDLKTAVTALERARSAEEHGRRADDERARNISLLETRILQSEAALRDERDAVERANLAQLRARRAHEAEVALALAEAMLAKIEEEVTANNGEIARCQAELQALELVDVELRRRALVLRVDELTAQERDAREQRRRAVDARESAGRLEAEALRRRLPSSEHLATLQTLQSEIQRRNGTQPTIRPRSGALPLLMGSVGAAIGFVAARYGASAGTALSVGSALVAGIAAAFVATLGNRHRQNANAQRAWQAETDRLESQLQAQTASVLVEAGVRHVEEIEAKRQHSDALRGEAERLREEAANLDRQADALFASCAGLLPLQRELGTLVDALAPHDNGTLLSRATPFADGRATLDEAFKSERDRLEQARHVADQFRSQRDEQSARCAAARAQLDNAAAQRGEVLPAAIDPTSTVPEADSRWRAAQTQLDDLRQERNRIADLRTSPSSAGAEIAVSQAKTEVALAEADLDIRRQQRQAVVDDLARANARLELAHREAEAVNLPALRQRVASAQVVVGAEVNPSGVDAARSRYERATQRASSDFTTVEHLQTRVVSAQGKAGTLASTLASDPATELLHAEDEERQLQAALLDAQAGPPTGTHPISPSDLELHDAQQAAARAEEDLIDTRTQAHAATSKRDDLRATAERARGDLEASERQALAMDVVEVERALTETRQTLAELPSVPIVTPEGIAHAERNLEDRDHELKACESSLNEARGKLELVSGRVGLERLQDEREAVDRAREYAEDQESAYEASRHLLELLEAAEATRASHLGRSLASPVAERFLALTGDLYAHVNLDPDLRLEGVVAAGSVRDVGELSVGTREQLATIVRLAIAAQVKTAVLLDDQLVHSDSARLEWFRTQLRNSVKDHDHQVIVMTCRLSDYSVDGENLEQEGETVSDGPRLTIIDVRNVVQRVRAFQTAAR